MGFPISRVMIRPRRSCSDSRIPPRPEASAPAPTESPSPGRQPVGDAGETPGLAPGARTEAPLVAGYASIEDVPDEHIRRLLTESLTRFGGTGTEDLVKRVARQLGFKRTGDVIRGRITTVLNDLIATDRVRVGGPDDRVWLSPPAP